LQAVGQVEEKDRELANCRQKLTELQHEHDALMKQSESAQRYLDDLPTAEEHAANLHQVSSIAFLRAYLCSAWM